MYINIHSLYTKVYYYYITFWNIPKTTQPVFNLLTFKFKKLVHAFDNDNNNNINTHTYHV